MQTSDRIPAGMCMDDRCYVQEHDEQWILRDGNHDITWIADSEADVLHDHLPEGEIAQGRHAGSPLPAGTVKSYAGRHADLSAVLTAMIDEASNPWQVFPGASFTG